MEVKKGYKQTEVGMIPEDWEVESFSKTVLKIASGVTKNSSVIGDFALYGSTGQIGEVKIPTYHGDKILIARVGANAGYTYRIRGSYGITDNTLYIVNKDNVLFDFLFYTLQKRNLNKLVYGSGQPLITAGVLKSLAIALPPSLVEQEAIAAVLSDTDALISSLETLLSKKRQIKLGTMQELLTRKRRLHGFSGEWETKRLGDFLEFQVGYPFSSKFFNQHGHGIRLIRNRDLKSQDQSIYYLGNYDLAFIVNNEDVLIGMDGDFIPCVWKNGPALLNQRVGRIKTTARLNPIFVYYLLYSHLKKIEDKTSATTVKHLSHSDVENIINHLPDFEEQTAIASVLSDMDSEIEALEKKISKYKQIKQGMMQKLLTGEIRLV